MALQTIRGVIHLMALYYSKQLHRTSQIVFYKQTSDIRNILEIYIPIFLIISILCRSNKNLHKILNGVSDFIWLVKNDYFYRSNGKFKLCKSIIIKYVRL